LNRRVALLRRHRRCGYSSGAEGEIEKNGAACERVVVTGAFRSRAPLRLPPGRLRRLRCIGLCDRGETTHYDYVCGESARGLMDLSVRERLAIGYGIVTVDTMEQAKARAFTDRGDKGGDAAHACLAMVALGRRWRNA
jgi:6,7-dimethyl-8-ribityllumazine synthase